MNWFAIAAVIDIDGYPSDGLLSFLVLFGIALENRGK